MRSQTMKRTASFPPPPSPEKPWTQWSMSHGKCLLSHWRDALPHSIAQGMPYSMELISILWKSKVTHGNQRTITETLPWFRISHGIPWEKIFPWRNAVVTLFFMGTLEKQKCSDYAFEKYRNYAFKRVETIILESIVAITPLLMLERFSKA